MAPAERACTRTRFEIGHKIFTPDYKASFESTQRPYAAWLYGSMTGSVVRSELARSLRIELGVTGPPAMGELFQRVVHQIIHYPVPDGWDRQLAFEPGVRAVLKRNPNYWKVDAAGTQLPYVEQVDYLIVPGTEAQVAQFMAGNLDQMNIAGAQFPNFKDLEQQGEEVDLEEHVAQFVEQTFVVAALDRISQLIGLLDRVRHDRALVLLAIPGAFAAQPPGDRVQLSYCGSGRFGPCPVLLRTGFLSHPVACRRDRRSGQRRRRSGACRQRWCPPVAG